MQAGGQLIPGFNVWVVSLLEDLLQLLHLERRERDPRLPLFPYFVCDGVIVKQISIQRTFSRYRELIYLVF